MIFEHPADINELRAKLTEVTNQREALLAELEKHRNGVLGAVSEFVTDQENLSALVENLNPIAARFGLSVVLRRPRGPGKGDQA